jgi:hypothetical protein
MALTLTQFETLDGLRNYARTDANRVSHIHGQPIRALHTDAWHQSRLFDALIEVLGYQAASDIADIEAFADDLITDCLIGKVEVIDLQVAA